MCNQVEFRAYNENHLHVSTAWLQHQYPRLWGVERGNPGSRFVVECVGWFSLS